MSSDRDALVDLTVAYCWALDSRAFDELDDVFLPDATSDLGGLLIGREAIKERIRNALVPLDVSQHMVSTQQFTVDGDRATGRCYLHAQHVKAGVQYVVAGRYEDRYVRTADGWRIEHRTLTVIWTSGDPGVLGG
jgi:hypothetical protein